MDENSIDAVAKAYGGLSFLRAARGEAQAHPWWDGGLYAKTVAALGESK